MCTGAQDLLTKHPFTAKVSSVLNKNVREFGKKFLFDHTDDTCWNSDQGSPQFITLTFENPLKISQVQIQFQGGFVGTKCYFEVDNSPDKIEFFPEDSNKTQNFNLDQDKCTTLKIVFAGSTDFFGRITIYHLKLF